MLIGKPNTHGRHAVAEVERDRGNLHKDRQQSRSEHCKERLKGSWKYTGTERGKRREWKAGGGDGGGSQRAERSQNTRPTKAKGENSYLDDWADMEWKMRWSQTAWN